MQVEKKVYQICLIGAPCSGKTSVLEGLRQRASIDTSPDIPKLVFIPDPWDSFAPLAPTLLNQINTTAQQIETKLKETPFTPIQPDLKNLIQQTNQIEINTLFDWYQALSLHFINDLATSHNQHDVRRFIQLDLLRIQLHHERSMFQTISSQHPTKRTLIVTDSACPTVLAYPRGIGQRIDSEEYKKLYIDNNRYTFWTEPDSATYYDTLVFFRSLTLSPNPEDYINIYNDGRRLDPPENARKIDYWLDRLVKCVCRVIPVVEFGHQTPLNEKVEQLYQYLNSETFTHNCYFHPYYRNNDWPTNPRLRWC